MARPAVTEPPGELMYRLIDFSGLSASRNSNWATTDAEVVSSTSPFRQTILSYSASESALGILDGNARVPLAVSRRYHL